MKKQEFKCVQCKDSRLCLVAPCEGKQEQIKADNIRRSDGWAALEKAKGVKTGKRK